ncbi:MAG: DUF5686 family protein [Cyclobacteriaceae bacterium]
MRKAIAKAKFHTQQLDEYSFIAYIKGKGKLKDYPWLAKKALEKEGITKDRLFISESVSRIKYTRPNKFEEKVIAVYTSAGNKNASPNNYFSEVFIIQRLRKLFLRYRLEHFHITSLNTWALLRMENMMPAK